MNKRGSATDTDCLIAAARKYFSQRYYTRAQQICRTILDQDPIHRVALYLSALCELYQDHLQEAVTALTALIEHHPDHVNGRVLLSKVYLRLGEHRQSTRYARKALAIGIEDDRVLALVAQILGESEDHESAKAAYEQAIRINPESAAHLCNYASILRIEGLIDEAIDALEKCIALDENHCKAHWMLSSLRQQTKSANHIARLERTKSRHNISEQGEMLIEFALSKEYEDIGKYEESFDCLLRACRMKRQSIDYDVERDTRLFRQLEDLFDSDYVRNMSGSGFGDYSPIFIVGLPRTGSTLIDQILAASGKLFSAGELPTFGTEMARLFHKEAGQAIDFSALRKTDVDYCELGRTYVENSIAFVKSAAHKAGFDSAVTFVDKMPQNFLYLGFIMLALPNAKIVSTHRGAVDTCLSNFKQLYNDPFYQFSYRLDEMASYFVAYHRLMQHWERLFGERIFSVKYEDFVIRPEFNAERVFEYCGVAWEREYLERARRSRFVATASATQVREAINVSSINRWKKYSRQLSSVVAQLGQAGLDIV